MTRPPTPCQGVWGEGPATPGLGWKLLSDVSTCLRCARGTHLMPPKAPRHSEPTSRASWSPPPPREAQPMGPEGPPPPGLPCLHPVGGATVSPTLSGQSLRTGAEENACAHSRRPARRKEQFSASRALSFYWHLGTAVLGVWAAAPQCWHQTCTQFMPAGEQKAQ